MGVELPAVLREFFRTDAAKDIDGVVACFTPAAEVVDDNVHHFGHAGIREWREDLLAAPFEYAVAALDAVAIGLNQYRLETRTTGSFPGGTVDLRYDVKLLDGLIDRLVIAPTQ
jgi:hypothetical protein